MLRATEIQLKKIEHGRNKAIAESLETDDVACKA